MVAMALPPVEETTTTEVPNELLDALCRTPLNGTQFRLMHAIVKLTIGQGVKIETISIADFAAQTGLVKRVISRELIRLTRRRIILAWGDEHHPKRFAIQKDVSQWLDSMPQEVSTDSSTDHVVSTNQSTPKVSTKRSTPEAKVWTNQSQSVDQLVDKLGTNQSTLGGTIGGAYVVNLDVGTKNDVGVKSSVSHETAASGTLRDRYGAKYQQTNNRIGIIGEAFQELLGAPPNYPRLGRMAKELNSGGKLIDLIFDASKARISDDPHDYLAKMVKQAKQGAPTFARPTQADLNSARKGGLVL